ncbi:MAG: ATP-dependent helicase [Microbacteriaceae bacterium]|nr:ATP-dependent helicase [Microbacteriaceae bacterium]
MVQRDDSQSAFVRLPDSASAVVVGAPGTGKTATLVELVAHRVLDRGWHPNDLVVIAPSRASASRLRDRLALRVAVPTEGPLARSINSMAFEAVSFARQLAGQPLPRLLTGGEQDSDIAQLLEGHVEEGTGPLWPDPLGPDVRELRRFRTELRDTMMRATEYGLNPERLRQLAREHDRPEWSAVADFQSEYLQVMGELRPHQLDAAELVAAAVRSIDAGVIPESLARLRLVIIDDVQEATRATLTLVSALSRRGASVIAFGDPDVASNAFRGGEADVVGRLGQKLGRTDISTLRLSTSHRQGTNLRALTGAVTARIGTAQTVGHRNPVLSTGEQAPRPGEVLTLLGPTPARLWSTIARRLREHHINAGASWNDMAIVVRSRAQVPAIARALALADVPTRTGAGGTPLREDTVVRALLAVVEAGIGRVEITAEIAAELLLGAFGGLDKLALRRLRLALRTEEIAGGGDRPSDELLVEALVAPGRFATIDHSSSRAAARLAETLDRIGAAGREGASIEELLWLVWDRSGRAHEWRAQALGSGILAAEANRNLDGVLALFTAAKRFVEREPGAPASAFLAAVLDAEVPEDTLAPAARSDAVLVTTPAGVLGLEFDTVVVAGLQDGVWPNLRLRGSLLYPAELVRAELEGAHPASGTETIDARKMVLFDELRMFTLAISRARREVILAAVANDDEAVSVFFGLAPDGSTVLSADIGTPLTLRGLVGKLRRRLTDSNGTDHQAAANLALLAEKGIPGAAPSDWHGVLDSSDDGPLFLDDEVVPVSPSKLGAFEESPLDWFIDSVSGTQSSTAMGLGTIVHWAMETATDPVAEAVWAAIESRWGELLFEAPWLAEQQKRAARQLASAVAEYLGDFEREQKQLVAAEERFSLEVGRARVNGSIDRVERSPDGGVVIVDLKTGKAETNQSVIDAFPQLGAYQLAYNSGVFDDVLDPLGEHRAGGAKLLFVREGKSGKSYREGVQAPLSDEQLEEFRDRIRKAAVGMALGMYPGSRVLDPYSFGDSIQRMMHRVRAVSSD